MRWEQGEIPHQWLSLAKQTGLRDINFIDNEITVGQCFIFRNCYLPSLSLTCPLPYDISVCAVCLFDFVYFPWIVPAKSSWNCLVSALLKKLPWSDINMRMFSPYLWDSAVPQAGVGPGEPVPPAWSWTSAVCARFSQCLLSPECLCGSDVYCSQGLLHMAVICPGFAAGRTLRSVTCKPSLPAPSSAQSIKPQLLVKFSLFRLVGVIRSCAWKSNQIINFLSVLFISLFVLFLERKLSQIAASELHYRFPLKQEPDNSIVAGVWVTVLPWQKSTGLSQGVFVVLSTSNNCSFTVYRSQQVFSEDSK